MRLVLREYLTESGSNPFREWLSGLDTRVRARVQARLMRFEEGNFGDHKFLESGVWEARLDFGPGYRVYFGREGDGGRAPSVRWRQVDADSGHRTSQRILEAVRKGAETWLNGAPTGTKDWPRI